MTRVAARAAGLFAGVALLASCSRQDIELSTALRAALENLKTPAGAQYDQAFSRSFADRHQPAMSRCIGGLAAKDIAPFDILARVASDGKLETVLVAPLTNVAECLRREMARDGYPAPPRPHYWVRVSMTFSG